jgi:hypothetical protein
LIYVTGSSLPPIPRTYYEVFGPAKRILAYERKGSILGGVCMNSI